MWLDVTDECVECAHLKAVSASKELLEIQMRYLAHFEAQEAITKMVRSRKIAKSILQSLVNKACGFGRKMAVLNGNTPGYADNDYLVERIYENVCKDIASQQCNDVLYTCILYKVYKNAFGMTA